jgi:N-acetylglucosamine-6-phosphate deacetylase
MSFCDIPLTEAIICATEAPAREVGIFGECGSLEVGKRADIIFAQPDPQHFDIKKIMLRGNII